MSEFSKQPAIIKGTSPLVTRHSQFIQSLLAVASGGLVTDHS